jgi:methionine-rich copper-binding protein CopC
MSIWSPGMTINAWSSFALCTLLTASSGAWGGTAAMRHNRLVKAEPAIEGTVAASPAAIRLWFKEPPEPAVSSIALLRVAGADSTLVALAPVAATDDKTSIAAAVKAPLAGGRYAVRWRTAGRDGHVIRGVFGFTVK